VLQARHPHLELDGYLPPGHTCSALRDEALDVGFGQAIRHTPRVGHVLAADAEMISRLGVRRSAP